MNQFRDDQEKKDKDHRRLVDQMREEYAKNLKDL